jgi:hypothetical protein
MDRGGLTKTVELAMGNGNVIAVRGGINLELGKAQITERSKRQRQFPVSREEGLTDGVLNHPEGTLIACMY